MIEVYVNLFVGSGMDYDAVQPKVDWSTLTCAKDPWHREALGYTTRGAPKDDPEYLFARRGRNLILNMIDAERAVFFAPDMVNAGLKFIEEELDLGQNVLIHCNQGGSRAPGMAMLYMWKRYGFEKNSPYDVAETHFRDYLYPAFQPSPGWREYIRTEWRRDNATDHREEYGRSRD